MLCRDCNEIVVWALSPGTAAPIDQRHGSEQQPVRFQLGGRAKTGQEVIAAAERGCYLCQISSCRGRNSIVANGIGEGRGPLVRSSQVYYGPDEVAYLSTRYEHTSPSLVLGSTEFGLMPMTASGPISKEEAVRNYTSSLHSDERNKLTVMRRWFLQYREWVHRARSSNVTATPLSAPISKEGAFFEHEIPRSTGNKKVLGMVRHWLLDCLVNHSRCIQMQSGAVPERLIDIRPKDGPEVFCVIETDHIVKQPEYLTLSHRWTAETPILSKTTVKKYQEHTLWIELPKTYQDAFATVKALGYRYIWIDSLCISQDARLDMLNEGLSMMQVYSSAVCNLSALEGRGGGMFTSRNPCHVGSAQRLLDPHTMERAGAVVLLDSKAWIIDVDEAPLNQRGWVLQEQFLAARTVYFGKTQVLWECRQGRRCEQYPGFEPFSVGYKHRLLRSRGDAFAGTIREIQSRANQPEVSPISWSNYSWISLWQSFISLYTARTISFPRDRLLAIAGIAKLFATASGLTWAAGFWKEHMPMCLLWDTVEHLSPYELTGIPTGSWASSLGIIYPVGDDKREVRVVARVTKIECETFGDDPFGLLSSARLCVEAPLIEAWLDVHTSYLLLSLDGQALIPTRVAPAWPNLPFVMNKGRIARLTDTTKMKLRNLDPDFVAIPIEAQAYVDTSSDDSVVITLRGLILEKLSDASQSSHNAVKWRRAGCFDIYAMKVVESSPILRSEIFNWSKNNLRSRDETAEPFDFDHASCLRTFDIF